MSVVTLQPLPTTGLWTIDSGHSTVRFGVRHHAVASFRGAFAGVVGAFDASVATLTGEVVVANAVLPGLDRLKDHFLTADFFDAANYPTLRFASRPIVAPGESFDVDGELTIRGISRDVAATATARGPVLVRHRDGRVSERLGVDLAATIDRRDYGLDFNSEITAGVLNLGWNVSIEVALELVREDTPS
jgi:polyisoprenoid-binding protein YceI